MNRKLIITKIEEHIVTTVLENEKVIPNINFKEATKAFSTAVIIIIFLSFIMTLLYTNKLYHIF